VCVSVCAGHNGQTHVMSAPTSQADRRRSAASSSGWALHLDLTPKRGEGDAVSPLPPISISSSKVPTVSLSAEVRADLVRRL
jgi:hypothetical protein